MGKSRFDGTERLAFRPWQRFICIHSDVGAGDRRRPICFFSPFGSSCALCTGLVSFVQAGDTRRTSHVPKDNDWHDVTRNFEMGELRGNWKRAVALVNFRVLVLGLETRWRPILKLLWPKAGKANTCFVPLHSLLLGFEIVLRSFHAHSFRAEVVRCQKQVSHQQKQAETNLIVQFARKRSLRHRLPFANSLALGSAPADFAETWYLD